VSLPELPAAANTSILAVLYMKLICVASVVRLAVPARLMDTTLAPMAVQFCMAAVSVDASAQPHAPLALRLKTLIMYTSTSGPLSTPSTASGSTGLRARARVCVPACGARAGCEQRGWRVSMRGRGIGRAVCSELLCAQWGAAAAARGTQHTRAGAVRQPHAQRTRPA
jgi:hypothetical protein